MKTTKMLLTPLLGLLITMLGLTVYGTVQPVSDDFNGTSINSLLWTNEDLGGASRTSFSTYSITSSNELSIAVPGGSTHDAYNSTLNIVRLAQPCTNTIWSVSAKFDSIPALNGSAEGIMFENAAGTACLRFDGANNYGNVDLRQWSGNITSSSSAQIGNVTMSDWPTTNAGPMYFRLTDTNGTYTTYTSHDNTNWTARLTYVNATFVGARIGVYADTSGSTPAFTMLVDYFYNDAFPPGANLPPTVAITSPVNNPIYPANSTINVDITASDSDGFVTNVQLYANGTLIGATDAGVGNAYSLTWSDVPAGTYALTAVATDNDGARSTNGPTIVHLINSTGAIVSDDFSSGTFNTNVWVQIDPLGNDQFSITGAGTGQADLNIAVAGGTAHDSYNTLSSPRLMQLVSDQDFTVVAKFDSLPSQNTQMEGIFVLDTNGVGVRADAAYSSASGYLEQWTGTNVGSGAALVVGNPALTGVVQPPAGLNVGTVYEMVQRQQGTNWMIASSPDGINWTTNLTFNYALTIAEIGVYAGNTGNDSALTAKCDYFMNLAAPISNINGTTNAPPTVTLNSPTSLANYSEGDTINFNVNATESSGSIARVDYYAWQSGMAKPVLVATATGPAPTFDAQWTNAWLGISSIYAVATANAGTAAFSSVATNIVVFSGPGGAIVSDDFNSNSVNQSVWTLLNTNNGTFINTNTYTGHADLLITANAAAGSGTWAANTAPCIVQSVANGAFSIDAKFDTVPALNKPSQTEGFIVLQPNGYNLSFWYLYQYSGQTNLTAFISYSTTYGVTEASVLLDNTVFPPATNGNTGTVYMKLIYDGSAFWDWYVSPDNTNWTEVAYFPLAIPVAQVGIFAGNAAGTPYTAAVDYFEDSNNPLVNQDQNPLMPIISPQPVSVTNNIGDTVNFISGAYGSPTPTNFFWEFDGNPLANGLQADGSTVSGSGTTNLTISNVQLADAGTYAMVAINPYGTNSGVAMLNVVPPGVLPVISPNPLSRTNIGGTTATFTSGATGTPAPAFYWLYSPNWPAGTVVLSDGGKITGSQTTSLSVSNVHAIDAGYYAMVASNSVGMATSQVAQLTFQLPAQPQISSGLSGGKFMMNWSDPNNVFTLTSATNVVGPYNPVPGATSPYTNSTSGQMQFFRLIWQ